MRPPAAVLLGLVATAALAAGCSAGRPSGAAFCDRLRADQAVLAAGITGPADIDATVARYRALAAVAPAAIRDQWQQLTALVEQAAALDPNDPAAAATLQRLAFDSQGAAADVADWARATCGVELRPPTSLPPTGAASGAAVAGTQPATAPATGGP